LDLAEIWYTCSLGEYLVFFFFSFSLVNTRYYGNIITIFLESSLYFISFCSFIQFRCYHWWIIRRDLQRCKRINRTTEQTCSMDTNQG